MKNKFSRVALSLTVALAVAGSLAFSQEKQTLYQRIGGYGKIAAIARDYFDLNRSDPRMSRFSGGRSQDSLKRARRATSSRAHVPPFCPGDSSLVSNRYFYYEA